MQKSDILYIYQGLNDSNIPIWDVINPYILFKNIYLIFPDKGHLVKAHLGSCFRSLSLKL